jgi:hypothetical protein
VVGEEAVEEGEVALAQGLHPGVALQRAGEAGEGAPAALHLLFDRLHLPGQQGLKAEGAALLAAEGGACSSGRTRHHRQADRDAGDQRLLDGLDPMEMATIESSG